MSQIFNKKLYSFTQLFKFIKVLIRTIKYKKKGLISNSFEKRILLTVTEVNGCEMCSYGHSTDALKEGMPEKDIHEMLTGNLENVPQDESVALFFAQHYADNNGNPTEVAWERVIETYGKEKALAILAIIRTIMVGNTVGIALGAFINRIKGKSVKKSSLIYELQILLSVIPFLIISIFNAVWKRITKQPIIQFDSQKQKTVMV